MKISVITPVFNCKEYLRDAIESVLNQNYKHCEHIIVDGGSTDGTIDILKSYDHLKWISETDNGQSHAMNKGFRMATGDIIVYLNADDYFLPGAFSAVIPYFESGVKFLVGKIKVVNDDGSYWINDAKTEHIDMLQHWNHNAFCVNPVGYFYLREVQETVRGFNENNHYNMDLEFLLECSKKYHFYKLKSDIILGVFRNIRNTKTYELASKPHEIWNTCHYPFIETFLDGKSEDFIRKFDKNRRKGFKRSIISGQLELIQNRPVYSFWLRIKHFYYSESKADIMLDYLIRHFHRFSH